ncbi:MAG: 50S ribosomal protein P1 [Thermoplasmata archaeon]|nr:50S ribosomal protein P1 [Candidatus Sysuiplasma acidicola]MBX8637244.1 50S ribosomal protein P1 [Candidatus Sysuiplasma acidicola]MBX8646262.1 50S ribosomal protein P1 [Candidatus Sysuiplasma acidicola]MDH2905388.1 50S ribosomal protein P1 [Methanomassiliicoccales archaeon]
MEYIYGALLLHSAGKEINEESVANVIKAAGIEPDPSRIKALTASLSGINIEEAIASAAVVAGPAQQSHAAPEKKEEKKKEEKKEEAVSEEEAAAGLGALFG